MTEVALLIADMVRAGVDPELIGRTAAALAQREAVLVPDEAAGRRRAKDAERKRLRKSAEVVGIGAPSPKEVPPIPPQEITPTDPSTHKETPLRGSKKGSRLPSDFAPDMGFALSEGLSPSQAETEAAKFRDFWAAKAGQGATKVDWQATWRNWVREALRRGPQQRAGPGPRLNPTLVAARKLMDELDAVSPSQTEGNSAPPRLLAFGGGRG